MLRAGDSGNRGDSNLTAAQKAARTRAINKAAREEAELFALMAAESSKKFSSFMIY
jgi:hypothetical protein